MNSKKPPPPWSGDEGQPTSKESTMNDSSDMTAADEVLTRTITVALADALAESVRAEAPLIGWARTLAPAVVAELKRTGVVQ